MFNLKLPMKKRYAEAVHNIEVLRGAAQEIDNGFVIQANSSTTIGKRSRYMSQQVLGLRCRPRPDRRSESQFDWRGVIGRSRP